MVDQHFFVLFFFAADFTDYADLVRVELIIDNFQSV